MRKTSQDGADAAFATSRVENETKKPKTGLLEFKSKKAAKRMPPNLSEESDDAVVEPLLQKNSNKTIQSAKYLAKAKADTVKEISKLFNDKKSQYASTSDTQDILLSEEDAAISESNSSSNAPTHNHMNTNVFYSHDNYKANVTTKSQLLVEIDGSKQSEYNPSPLIFTTAKIHMDGKSNHMEPVQMTPGPILSTVEVSVTKSGSIITNEKKVSNGTSVMNTLQSQPNEKVTMIKSKDPSKPSSASLNSTAVTPSQIIEKTKESTTNASISNVTSITQSVKGKNTNLNKSPSPVSSDPLETINSPPETSKPKTPIDHKNKGVTKDTNDTKKLNDEPRILMSESKMKSTALDSTKSIPSGKIAGLPLEQTNVLESSKKEGETSQPNNSEKVKSEKNNTSFEQNAKIKHNIDIKDSESLQNKNIRSPTVPKELVIKSNTKNTKTLQQKNTTTVGAQSLKNETNSDNPSSSKKTEFLNDSSAKSLSSSTKTPTQPKAVDNKLSKEIDKSPKPSANEITKTKSKTSLNNTATSSTNKIPTSVPITKSNVTPANTTSSNINDTLNKSSRNPKAISITTTASSSAIKTVSTSTKTAVSSVSTKPTSVTSTKSSTKPSTVSSIKSPQITSTISVTKQQNTPTSTKTVSGKPLSSTKIPQENVSAGVTSPSAKPIVSKIAQVSLNNPPTHASSSVASSSIAAVDASNKTKAPESTKKDGSKLSDSTKASKS